MDKKQRALVLLQENSINDARVLLEEVRSANQDDIDSRIILVRIYAQTGQPDKVVQCCREILATRPNLPQAHHHLGVALLFCGKRKEAIITLREASRLDPRNPETLFHLGKALHLETRFDEALLAYEKTLELAPDKAEIYDSIGSIYKYRGETDNAVETYRKALTVQPDFYKAHSDLIFALNYSEKYESSLIFSEHKRWGEMHAGTTKAQTRHSNTPDTGRRIRVGYVSPDFYKHSVSFFFEPLIKNHDKECIETICYSETINSDDTTKRLKKLANHWRDTRALNDIQMANMLLSDKIDILVDLAGHTANNRLGVFAFKPAPIQVTYLGYPNTTGLSAIDYRLTDSIADPAGEADRLHTETLVRLPHGFLCYQPPDDTPQVCALPADSNGYITLGSFNNLAKITVETINLWSEILCEIPDSRMVIKNISLGDDSTRARYLELFKQRGVSEGQLSLLPPIYKQTDHLRAYNQIDISLDTYPYNGTTTTCEALWMGVPVISQAGNRHASRVGASLLSQVGMPELIAKDPDEFVRTVINLSNNREKLAQIRMELRNRMATSPLCDGKTFAKDIETVYRTMWDKWCMVASATSN